MFFITLWRNRTADLPRQRRRWIRQPIHPFYRWLLEEAGEAAAAKWNFHKVLLAPDGSLAGLWPSAVEPLAPEVTQFIEDQLPG